MSVHVTAWVWLQQVGDPEAKLVLLKLADQANDDGECWPSQRTIAAAVEASVSTVKRRLSYLVARNLLIVEERAREGGLRTSNLYTVPYRSVPPSAASSPVTYRDPAVSSPADLADRSTVTYQEPSVEPSVKHQLGGTTYRHMSAEGEERRQRDAEGLTAEENKANLERLRSELGL